jgi:hypothetical protein
MAVCAFPDAEPRPLPVVSWSVAGASLLALRVPTVGTTVIMTLRPRHLPALPPLTARVIAARVDPAQASRSGFQVVFTEVDEATRARLCFAAAAAGLRTVRHHGRPGIEARRHPRVATNLVARVAGAGWTATACVANLSLIGALLDCGSQRLAAEAAPGSVVRLEMHAPGASARVAVRAEVVRVIAGRGRAGLGLRFAALDDDTAVAIEGLILDALGAPEHAASA